VRDSYIPGQRRPVLIRLDRAWRPARLQGWHRQRSGWVAYVTYRTGEPIFSSRFAALAAVDVRDAQACETCPAARRAFASLGVQ
jgi:hypothetical protein